MTSNVVVVKQQSLVDLAVIERILPPVPTTTGIVVNRPYYSGTIPVNC